MKTKLALLLPTLLGLTPAPAGAAVRYVNLANLSPAPPYTTWPTAATNIQDAVDAADAGDEVVVTNGVYATGGRLVCSFGITCLTNRLVVADSVIVRSVNGPEMTTIVGYQDPETTNGFRAVRCVYLANGARLVGFALTHGGTIGNWDGGGGSAGGGGVFCASASAMVSQCAFSSNSAYAGGGALGGTLNNCVFMSNSAVLGGGAFERKLNGCVLTGNSASIGGGAFVSTLNNCTLTGNSARGYGGGAYGGTLNNCILTGNTALVGGGAYSGAQTVVRLNNCTITSNSAGRGGGVGGQYGLPDCCPDWPALLTNCIVTSNQAQDGANYSPGIFAYSCTSPLPPGPGNIDADPGFVDPGAGDLRLRASSPCIDAGTNLSFITVDILGRTRPLDGNGDCVAEFDIGAYEFEAQTAIPLGSLIILGKAIGADGRFHVSYGPKDCASYYVLSRSTSIDVIGLPVALQLGADSEVSELIDPTPVAGQEMAFYRIRAVPRTQPLDLDHDGIDDYYELRHAGFLNPLNLADAAQDTDGDGYSNLAEYRAGTDPARPTVRHSIASGLAHTVVLKQDGSLWAWGDNTYGQLGDGTYDSRAEPVRIGTDTDWISVSAGRDYANGDFTVALKRDGSLWFWGSRAGTNAPTRLGNENNWADVSAGGNSIVAMKKDGSLWYPQAFSPSQRIGTDRDWVTVSSGGQHVLALKADRSLWAWGDNGNGQCGLGEGVNVGNTPTRVGTDNDWVAIAASGDTDIFNGAHSLGLKADGSLWSWGLDWAGELGLGSYGFYQFTPARIGTDTDWAAIAAGGEASLARKRNGRLWSWGTGIGSVPRLLNERHDWRDFAAGGAPGNGRDTNFATAVAADGSLWMWRFEPFVYQVPVPTRVGAETNWAAVTAGGEHSLALKLDGSLWSWGRNEWGQLGNGMSSFGAGGAGGAGLHRVASNTTWRTVSAGGYHTLALGEDGTLWAWGGNDYGQLGVGTFSTNNWPFGISTPQAVATNMAWQSVAAGGAHTVALRTDGSLWTWGRGTYGELGNSVFTTNAPYGISSPLPVEPAATWSVVTAGDSHTIGLRSDGSLWACGWNLFSQLGLSFDTINAPYGISTFQRVPTNVVWKSIVAGSGHTVALSMDGKLWAWGLNNFGQLGNGSLDISNSPQSIAPDKSWRAVAAGGSHTVALDNDGMLWVWGNNSLGQLGFGTSEGMRNTPQLIQPNTTWKAIAAGGNHTLAIREDGTLWSWGYNSYGQLGITPDLISTRLGTDTDWGSPP